MRVSAVVKVIPVVDVIDVNIIGLVPGGSPVFWIWVNETEPIATELEARIPSHYHKREAVDPKIVTSTTVAVEIAVWNSVPMIAASLMPSTMLRLPAVGAMLLPDNPLLTLLGTLLLLCEVLLCRSIGLVLILVWLWLLLGVLLLILV